MAEAVVADFEGGFGDIALTGAKKFGGAFHPELAEVLLDRHTAFLAKKPAEVKRAAADLLAKPIERGRFGKVFTKDLPGALDSVPRGALGACAKKFAGRRTKEKMRGQFKGFAAKPNFPRRLEDGALLETFDELKMQRAEAFGSGDGGLFGATQNFTYEWMKILFLRSEMFAQKRRCEFDRDEAMFLVCFASRA